MADGIKRIKVGKSDSLEAILKQISKIKNSSVVLYIPRGAELVKEARHLSELYAHAKSLGKELSIESVDDEVLAMASLAGIKAGNSFYASRPRQVADILPRKPEKVGLSIENYAGESDAGGLEKPFDFGRRSSQAKATMAQGKPFDATQGKDGGAANVKPRKKGGRSFLKTLVKFVVIAGALSLGVYYCVAILPSAAITLNFKQTPWNFTGQMSVNAGQSQISVGNNQVSIPGQLFDATKTMTQVFTASGTRYVQTKAAGTVTIYNDYGTSPQTLIATTRLVNESGIMFRLDKTITVPGATYSGGKLVPGQITATVTAGNPGSQYNLPAGQTFHFAGFAGTKKYNGFYAQSSQAMAGGFIGQAKAPSESDIAQATSSVGSALQSAMAAEIGLQAGAGIKFLDGGSSFTVTKYDVANVPNSDGQFAVTAYGEYKVIGFKEQDLVTAMASQVADSSNSNLEIKNYSATYGTPKVDWKHNSMTVPVAFQSSWEPAFDAVSFKKEVAGKNQSELKQSILAVSGIESSGVKLWPFWVRAVPVNVNKITIDTN